MNKKLFNVFVCTVFLLSAVMPARGMGFTRSFGGCSLAACLVAAATAVACSIKPRSIGPVQVTPFRAGLVSYFFFKCMGFFSSRNTQAILSPAHPAHPAPLVTTVYPARPVQPVVTQYIERFTTFQEFQRIVETYQQRIEETSQRDLRAKNIYLLEVVRQSAPTLAVLEEINQYCSVTPFLDKTIFALYVDIRCKHERNEPLSQTETHILVNINNDIHSFIKVGERYACFAEDAGSMEMIKDIITHERLLIEQGYAVFYHGQNKNRYFPIALDTFLYGVRHGWPLEADNFLLMHTCQENGMNFLQPQQQFLHDESVLRDDILRYGAAHHGAAHHGAVHQGRRDRMLFLNDSLFGNRNRWGGQTYPHYFEANFNGGGGNYAQPREILKNIFNTHGYGDLYIAFADELHNLYERYIALSRYGTLYQIAVPQVSVHEVIRVVQVGGTRTSLDLRNPSRRTEDMQEIIQALRNPHNYPEQSDTKEYVAAMTHDEKGMRNPACGIKVFPYMVTDDKQLYAIWHEEWQQLQDQMRAFLAA